MSLILTYLKLIKTVEKGNTDMYFLVKNV